MGCRELNIQDYFSFLKQPSTDGIPYPPSSAVSYTYDTMSRLATVSDSANTATYTRISGSSLLDTTVINNGTADALTVDRNYDKRTLINIHKIKIAFKI